MLSIMATNVNKWHKAHFVKNSIIQQNFCLINCIG